MFGRVKRHWWRVAGIACIARALWFYHKAAQAHEQWERQIEETENKWKEIEKQLLDKIAAGQQPPDRLGESRFASEIIELQTEQYQLQRAALRRTQDLCYERYNSTDLYLILDALGFFIICVGQWHACLAERKANCCAPGGEDEVDPDAPPRDGSAERE
jgi:hypothetical protein